jgi:hypothetical protein
MRRRLPGRSSVAGLLGSCEWQKSELFPSEEGKALRPSPVLLVIAQTLQVLDRYLALRINTSRNDGLKKMLAGNNACLHI